MGYWSAWYNKNGTNPLSYTSNAINTSHGTYSTSIIEEGTYITSYSYWNSVFGNAASQNQQLSFTFLPETIDMLGIDSWYIRIGRTHNTYMNCRFHCIRIYNRSLTKKEI